MTEIAGGRVNVLVYGAGVIGQIYGGRLQQAGHDVTMLARRQAERLATHGVRLERDNDMHHVVPRVIRTVPHDAVFDVVLITVRRDHLPQVVPGLGALTAARVVFMLNTGVDLEGIREQAGRDRTVFAFPGVGGRRLDDGTIRYFEISQQKTAVEDRRGAEVPIVQLLRSAGFAVDLQTDMAAWMKTHVVFITAVSAAILAAGGDSEALAADRGKVADMVQAVGEGFRALQRQGVRVTPPPLRLAFTVVPRFLAVSYWQRQLRGPVGTLALAPHIRAARETELPVMRADVHRLIAGHGPTPHLDRLLQSIGVG
jgi:2-dehydropantoate 2-reductase